jgi:hypothetical protein
MDLDDKKISLNPDEFVQKKGLSESGQMLEIKEIVSGKYKIERWSREILKIVFNTDVPQASLFEVDDY